MHANKFALLADSPGRGGENCEVPLHSSFTAIPTTSSDVPPDIPPLDPRELASILRSLPSRSDMAKYVVQMQASLKSEISELRVEVQDISSKVVEHGSDHTVLEQRVAQLECSYQESCCRETQFLLKIDDLENRGRRNNIKI